jgi:hypothetical protein
MQILSHRGYWQKPEEKNGLVAFERSFSLGFGTETDFRDCNGELVISHDLPIQNVLKAEDFFKLLLSKSLDVPIAINIKSDGLQRLLISAIEKYSFDNYFLFDMSVPDAIQSLKAGLRIFTRQSEIETIPVLYEEAAGVWMDAFQNDNWINENIVSRHLENGKSVCLVSPELHGRSHLDFWNRLRRFRTIDENQIMLCTDLPEKARDFFSNE